MTDRPILFSAPMVLALLKGRKTQTRRLAWRDPDECVASLWHKVNPGDRLWVRETLRRFDRTPPTAQYAATITAVVAPPGKPKHVNGAALWNYPRPVMPSIHMPRWASRIDLEVTAVRIERLWEIDEADAKAEGVERGDDPLGPHSYVSLFENLWGQIHGPDSWAKNPEVVVLTFEVWKDGI